MSAPACPNCGCSLPGQQAALSASGSILARLLRRAAKNAASVILRSRRGLAAGLRRLPARLAGCWHRREAHKLRAQRLELVRQMAALEAAWKQCAAHLTLIDGALAEHERREGERLLDAALV